MAEPVNVTVPHRLGREEAKRRIGGGIGQLQQMIPGSRLSDERWDDDRFSFTITAFGQVIDCRLAVFDERVDPIELRLVQPQAGVGQPSHTHSKGEQDERG